jgi:hypothetical protein
MHEKVYDITLDSAGWSCHAAGTLLGTFPSWLLAIAATRAAVERDRRNGLAPVVRYQDLKGSMHMLDLDSNDAEPPQMRSMDGLGADRLAGGQRPH